MKNYARSLAVAALTVAMAVSGALAAPDQFGVSQLYPTASGGQTWYSKWANGVSRSFTGVDPNDAWFDAAHGSANYYVDGKGQFYITGSTPRMYVHDPAKSRSWHDVEMTVYAMRVADDGTAYGGIVGVTRSNHGTTAPELSNLCDTRGYGGRVRYDGNVDFDKETSHPHATAIATKSLFSGGMPKNKWIGYKHVTYDMPNGHVMNEIWIDLTDGANGGSWQKVNSFEDNGSNFGVGATACRSGINPALMLTNSDARPGSESGKPNITVYWRSTNVGAKGLVYKKMSVREITAGSTSSGGGTVASAPVVSGVTASNITQTGVTITWKTDKASRSEVEYGKSTSYGSSSGRSADSATSHQVTLSGLTAGTAYHYRAKSLDDATGLTGVSGDLTFTTAGSSGSGGSVVSNVKAADITDSAAGITWNTTTVSHSQVEYGVSTSYGSLSYRSSATGTSHYIPLSKLKAGTVYHYRVLSLNDATGKTDVSGDNTLTTTGGTSVSAPVISNVAAANLADTGANINWSTDKVSHSQVEYGLTASYGSLSYQSSAAGTSHQIPLAGLKPATVYHYRVKSLDSATGLTGVSGDNTFKTTGAAATAPAASGVSASGLTQTAATITWSTDKPSNSEVEYGKTTAYGFTSGRSSDAATSHKVALSGLAAGTAYHYRVKSFDASTGLTGVSGDFTFTTQAASVAPLVSNVTAVPASNGATITWSTDKVSHSQVEYGVTASYGTQSYLSTAAGTAHWMSLSGLSAGVTYHYRVKSLDSATGLTGVSGDLTFTIPGGSAGSGGSSAISSVLAQNVTTSGANITWQTTTVSHSQVEYGLTASYGSKSYQSSATGKYHSMPLSGLKPGTVYHYRVLSLDSATGKTDVSADYTFKTSGTSA